MNKTPLNVDNKNLTPKEELMEILRKGIPEPTEDEKYYLKLLHYQTQIKEMLNQGLKITHNQVAKKLMEFDHYKTMRDIDEIYIYRKGIYEKDGEVQIKENVQTVFIEDATTHFTSEVIGVIKRSTYTKRELFDADPDLITVENGILNIITQELKDFTPDHLSLTKFPMIYDPEARAIEILKFLEKVVSPRDVEKLKEFFGYLLENGYPIHRCFMLHGDTDRGKTTFVRLIQAFIGEENISTESLQDLQGKFSMAQLYGKLANISDDLSNIEIKSAGNFKRLCGESPCRGRQLYQKPFTFWNRAKGLFTTNEMPQTRDKTDAFYNRWELIPFIIQFYHNAEPRIIPNYIDQLTTKEELSGLLNLAIEKLLELRQNGQFTNSNTPEQNREQWNLLADPIFRFIDEQCEEEINAWIGREEFYLELSKYLAENNAPPISSNKLTRKMKEKYSLIRRGSKGQQKEGWLGIKLKEEEEGLKKYDIT